MGEMLSESQSIIFRTIITSLQNRSGNVNGNVFLVRGPAGTGKTFMLNHLIRHCKSKDIKVIAMAYTGIASCALINGKTVHSQFRIPWNSRDRWTMHPKSPAYKAIKSASVVLWDQAANCSRSIFEGVDQFIRSMMNSNQLFGGKVVAVFADFHECSPIVRSQFDSSESQSLINSPLYNQMQRFNLHRNHRFGRDDYRMCLEIGSGIHNEVFIPPECRIENMDALIRSIYGNGNMDYVGRSILTVTAADANYMNSECLRRHHGSFFEFSGTNFFRKIDSEKGSPFFSMEETMDTLPKYFPPNVLQLSVNTPIILRQTFRGLQQGTRMTVKKINRNKIVAQVDAGDRKDRLITICRVNTVKVYPRANLEFVRRQFPISLAYSMTINRAQGVQFKKLGIYFSSPVFSHGQLYVAFSRVPNIRENLKVLIVQPNNGRCSYDRMPNVVSPEISRHLLPINV